MYNKILIATDGSNLSKEAENQGLELAKKVGGTVTVLYVEDINIPSAMVGPYALAVEENIEEIQNRGKEIVDAVKKKGKKMGIAVITMLLKGHPAEEIINQALIRLKKRFAVPLRYQLASFVFYLSSVFLEVYAYVKYRLRNILR